MSRKRNSPIETQRGFVAVLVSLFFVVLVTSVGFAVDIGRAQDEKQQIQIAADAASFAAAAVLGPQTDLSTVTARVESIAKANGASLEEVRKSPPRCGAWTNGAFVPHARNVCDSQTTAVEVTVSRAVPMKFAKMVRSEDISIEARSVSYIPPAVSGNCIRPFGVEASLLNSIAPAVGSTITVGGTQESGNWGKIDLNGNSSSGQVFTSLMMNNLCDEGIGRGKYVTTGTGNAQIWQVFDTLLADETPPLAWQGMIFAVTSDMDGGNCTVQIERFIKVDLLSQRGSGSNWRATLRIVDLDAEPESPVVPTRQIVQ